MKTNKCLQTISAVCFIIFSLIATASNQNNSTTNQTISVHSKQPKFIIKLKANHTTGYSWSLKNYNSKLIKLNNHKYIAPSTKLLGAPGFEVWTFSVNPTAFDNPQVTTIELLYAQPWQKNVNNKSVKFNVKIEK